MFSSLTEKRQPARIIPNILHKVLHDVDNDFIACSMDLLQLARQTKTENYMTSDSI